MVSKGVPVVRGHVDNPCVYNVYYVDIDIIDKNVREHRDEV